MLIDEVDIIVKGGHGGPGCVSFIGKHGGPDGGDGGKGGDVLVEATTDLYALNKYAYHTKLQTNLKHFQSFYNILNLLQNP